MGRIDAQSMGVAHQQLLVDWLKDQGLKPDEISGIGFSVHNGRISGHRFLLAQDGQQILWREGQAVKVPFNVAQTKPLPEELQQYA